MKREGEKIAMVTAYDAPTASFAEAAGVDAILIGDSLAMNTLGFPETVFVSMDDMIAHAKAARRGAPNTFLIGDMPFLSCHLGVENGIRNAGRFIQEAACDAVKMECTPSTTPLIRALVEAGIPVMGHLGLLPQGLKTSGAYRVQGRAEQDALALIERAAELQDAGCFAIVLECIPLELGRRVSERLEIPTIGIGAGPCCDGQIQVVCDVLGYSDSFLPKHAKRFCRLGAIASEAFSHYVAEVKAGTFPARENSFE